MKKLIMLFVLAISSCVLSFSSFAQEFKVGYVSLERLMAESLPAKVARSELEAKFKMREKNLDTTSASIRLMQQSYEKNFSSLSATQKEEREKELLKTIKIFEADRTSYESDLSSAQSKSLQSLLAKADAVIKNLAEKEGFDLIVQEAVYIKPENDLTQRVLKILR